MSDSHEEQLLTDLFGAIAREDASLDAGHLEAPAAARWELGIAAGRSRRPYYLGAVIAGLAAAAVLLAIVPRQRAPQATQGTEVVVSPTPSNAMRATASPRRPAVAPRVAPKRETMAALPQSDAESSQPDSTPALELPAVAAQEPPMEFVPLSPLTPQELSGSFQIVRVQLPRASLGRPQSPFEQPNELVEADVLLGEDGMARAIRISAADRSYPWRPK